MLQAVRELLMSTAELEECKPSVYSQVWFLRGFLLIIKSYIYCRKHKTWRKQKKNLKTQSTTERYLKHLRACVSKWTKMHIYIYMCACVWISMYMNKLFSKSWIKLYIFLFVTCFFALQSHPKLFLTLQIFSTANFPKAAENPIKSSCWHWGCLHFDMVNSATCPH